MKRKDHQNKRQRKDKKLQSSEKVKVGLSRKEKKIREKNRIELEKRIAKWEKEGLKKLIQPVPVDFVKSKISTEELDKDGLRENKKYQSTEDLFGVKIETGYIILKTVSEKEAVLLLSKFLDFQKKGKRYEFTSLQNLEGLIQTAEKFGLEKPEPSTLDGYILNGEMVSRIEEKDFSYLRLKYKHHADSIYLVYRFYFIYLGSHLTLVMEKTVK